ncbi:MAG: acetyl-CoA carboxylase biotin carboxyl carrier protein subunit [Verrucomicrobiae bacterium]|nr:acetyl-CoA carboxylase biotin carboxyl carrier protein subunit [Verrucomicrobiae bacterium]
MIRKLRVTVDGKPFDVTVEIPDEAGGAPLAAPPATPGAAAPATPSAPVPIPVAAPAAASGPAGPGDVPSPLSGRVTAIIAQVGQPVEEGDHLITLEAMKMNTFVFAPRAGKVAEIKVAVGAAVDEGQALARLE